MSPDEKMRDVLQLSPQTGAAAALTTVFIYLTAIFSFVFSLVSGIFMVIGDVGFIHGRNLGGGITLIVLSVMGFMSLGGVLASILVSVVIWGMGQCLCPRWCSEEAV